MDEISGGLLFKHGSFLGEGEKSGRGSLASLRMTSRAGGAQQEEGYVLLGVVFFVALILLSLAIAAPKVAASIQRDRELELIHRGEQYKRAIKLYYKKFGSYPGTMEQLEKSNNIRFLRKRYTDPLTGKDDWKLIHIGEAHLHPLGFFGKPLSATGSVGGASGLNGGTSTALGQGSQTGQSLGTSSSGTSSFGGTTTAPSSGGLYAGVDNSGTSGSGSGDGSGTGTGSSSGSSSGFGSSSGSSSGSSTGFGASTSQTLGGAPIVGVVVASTKSTIVEYKLQKTYKDWEFVYDPVEEQAVAAGSLLGGGAVNGNPTGAGGIGVNGGSLTGAPSTGSGSSGSSGNSGSGTGSVGSSGSSGGTTPQ
jgi:type II secretory pathway pseudopilin PulG